MSMRIMRQIEIGMKSGAAAHSVMQGIEHPSLDRLEVRGGE